MALAEDKESGLQAEREGGVQEFKALRERGLAAQGRGGPKSELVGSPASSKKCVKGLESLLRGFWARPEKR